VVRAPFQEVHHAAGVARVHHPAFHRVLHTYVSRRSPADHVSELGEEEYNNNNNGQNFLNLVEYKKSFVIKKV
jgi:hypothetical protein